MARASWLAPLIAIGVNIALVASQGGKALSNNKIQMIVGPLLIFGGFILGIVALFGISKFGRKKILGPAIIGIGVNLLLIVAGIVPVLRYMANRSHLQAAVHTPSAYLLKNERLRFAIDIPEGFRDFPEGKQGPTIEHLYVKGVVGGGEVLTVINIEKLGHLIPKNKPLTKDEMPPGFTGEITTRNWRGLKVDSIIAPVGQNGARMIVYTTQIPLKPMAIQLSVGGPESKRNELSELTDTLLASLEGETNW